MEIIDGHFLIKPLCDSNDDILQKKWKNKNKMEVAM